MNWAKRALAQAGWILAAWAVVAAILWLDLHTPDDYSLVVLYLIPVVALTLTRGRAAGIAVSAAAVLAWTYDSATAEGFAVASFAANYLSRLLIFAGIVVLIDMYRLRGERLAQVDRQREESLTLVAHKLRETAGRISALTDALVAREADVVLGSETRRTLERQAHELRRMAEDVLDVNLLENKRFRLNVSEVDLTRLVSDVTREIAGDRATLVVQADPVLVEGDVDRLRVMLEHIVGNAKRYSPPGAEMMVTVAGGSGQAKVVVKDQGVGLASSDLKVLFKKYGQATTAKRGTAQGIGLGLYLTRLLAEAHGGSVTAESVGPGLGSTFRLSLPLRQPRDVRG